MRHLLSFALSAVVLVTVWFNYAPPHQRAALPPSLQTAIIEIDSAFSRGITLLSAWVGDYASELGQPASAPEEWVANGADGIVRVYENPPVTGQGNAAQIDPSTDTQFLGAQLVEANMSRASLSSALLDSANARGASFVNADLSLASGRLAVFRSAVFHRSDLTGATLQRADFDRTIIIESNFRDTQFTDASFVSTHIRGGSGIGARFDRAAMTQSLIEGTDLRRASFAAAALDGSVFVDVQLHGARFDGAELSGTDLSRATGLTQLALSGACGDSTTRLPPGLSITPCTAKSYQPNALAGLSPSNVQAELAAYRAPATDENR